MLSFVFPLLLLSTRLSGAAKIDEKKAFSDLYSLGRDLMHADIRIAANLAKINHTTWSMTLKDLVPDLKGAAVGVQQVAAAFNKYVNVLQQQSKSSNDVYVPDAVFAYIINNAKNLHQQFKNVMSSHLTKLISENSIPLHSHSGNVIIPKKLALRFTSIFKYLSEQFNSAKHSTMGLQVGFLELAQILNSGTSSFMPFLFRAAAITSSDCGRQLGYIADDLNNLIRMYEQVSKRQLNGDILLPSGALAKASSNAIQHIAESFNRLADNLNLFLENVTSSSDN